MIELAPNIYYIPGKNHSRFPYCACLYLKGKSLRVLIDAGMGTQNILPAKKMGIDVLLFSHCHIDHRLTQPAVADVPVWCHVTEKPFFQDQQQLFAGIGFSRGGIDAEQLFKEAAASGLLNIEVARTLEDNERIDLGGMTLVALHTPGHTPGHLAFYIPEHEFLFSADIALTPFGPFYGHHFASIDDFIESIERLKQLKTRTVATGHAGPFNQGISEKFEAYKRIIDQRDQLLLAQLEKPRTLDWFKGRNLFYRVYAGIPELIMWFELVHIEKHLARLAATGKVINNSGQWQRRI
jgi:glyoxylase-like metal-dependent hydrolase (beta-lactamase superfamily II)